MLCECWHLMKNVVLAGDVVLPLVVPPDTMYCTYSMYVHFVAAGSTPRAVAANEREPA